MGYGVVGEDGLHHLVAVPAAEYGEDRTESVHVDKLPVQDVSIHTALGTWERYEYNRLDHAGVGLMSYVENGSNQDFAARPDLWPTYVRSRACTSFVVGFRLAANGGFLKGHFFVQYWDRPEDYEVSPQGITSRDAHAVYDAASGRIHHVHHRVTLSGTGAAAAPFDPVELARTLGHDGELAVVEVDPAELGAGPARVDPGSGRLVPAAPRG